MTKATAAMAPSARKHRDRRHAILVMAWLALALVPGALSAQDFACVGHGPQDFVVPAAKTLGAGRRVPTRGHIRVLLVHARFQDEASIDRPPPDWTARLFDPDHVGSLTHFYRTMSFGQLHLDGGALARRYSSDHAAAHYVSPDPGEMGAFGLFAREVLAKVDRDLDMRLYDNDGPDGVPDSGDDDGYVDYVFINMLSIPYGFLRGGATGIGGLLNDYVSTDIGRDGNQIRVRGGIGYGAILLERGFTYTAGVMAHEFGHGLGLPDLYDLIYEDPETDSAGIGAWGLMGWGALGWNGDDGPNPLSAWSLEQLGWISPESGGILRVDNDVEGVGLEPVLAGGAALRIDLSSGVEPDYLLLEQRTRSSSYYDRHLPAEGVLAWHVRPAQYNNFDEFDKRVDLICADGLYRDAGFPLGRRPDGLHGGDNLDFWAHDPAYNSAHGGNWGDPTDPFDGIRFARLYTDGNPSTRPRSLISSAFSALDVRFRRQGAAMVADVTTPRWAGTIREDVSWAGRVLVDGDLRIAPTGHLSILEGTQVIIAGQDRMRQGLDPRRVEVLVEGGITVGRPGGTPDPVVFETIAPRDSWYGIQLAPGDDSVIDIEPSSYRITRATRGIVFPGAPDHSGDRTLVDTRLIDAADVETAGNGDGQLGPGETFQVAVDISNWSLQTYRGATGQLRWRSDLVLSADETGGRVLALELPTIYPGAQRTVRWPSLTVSPAARSGERVSFSLTVRGIEAEARQDSLDFVVRGSYPTHHAEWTIAGRPTDDGLALVPTDGTTRLQARVEGDVARVDLVVHPADGSLPGTQIPMDSTQPGVFETDFDPPAIGGYRIALRIRSGGGSVVFSDTGLDLWAIMDGDIHPALICFGAEYWGNRKQALTNILTQNLELLGRTPFFVSMRDGDLDDHVALLRRFAHDDALVIWFGDIHDAGVVDALASVLDAGGRLLLASNARTVTSRTRAFLETSLFTGIGGSTNYNQAIHPLEPIGPGTFTVQYSWLTPVPPAGPLLMDSRGRPAGLRVDTGTYRAIFLPFDLSYVAKGVLTRLLEPSLLYLQQQSVGQVSLEAVGVAGDGQAALVQPRQTTRLRARIEGVVSRAELIVRRGFLSDDETVETLPMQPVRQVGGTSEYEASFTPPEPGRFRLILRSYDADGGTIVTAAGLTLLALDTTTPMLLLGNVDPDVARLAGLPATLLQTEPGDWQLFGMILSAYLDDGDLVIWEGGTPLPPLLNALRDFLDRGGRLLLSSSGLHLADDATFLRKYLHVSAAASSSRQTVSSAGLLAGPPLDFQAVVTPLDRIHPPAVPMLLTDKGTAAGVQVQDGDLRAVYLPFRMSATRSFPQETIRAQLVTEAVHFLRGERADVELDIPGHEVLEHHVMVPADRAVTVRARVRGTTDAVHLVVRDHADPTRVDRLAMTAIGGDGDDRLYICDFLPPRVGHYLLYASLEQGGDSFVVPSSLRVDALSFDVWHPALVLLDAAIPPNYRVSLRRALQETLLRHGLTGNFVDSTPTEGPLYEALLSNYQDPGDVVLWFGGLLDLDAQHAVRSFVDAGGRLLMASGGLRYSPGAADFLAHVFGVSDIAMGFPTIGREFRSPYRSRTRTMRLEFARLEPDARAEAALSDSKSNIAGVRFGNGAQRTVFLSFNLYRLDAEAAAEIVEDNLLYLWQPDVGEAQLHFDTPVFGSDPAPAAAFSPRVVVSNLGDGDGDGDGFRVGYQVRQAGDLVVTYTRDVAAVAAGGESALELPAWSAVPGDHLIRYGLGSPTSLEYGPWQHLHVLDRQPPFERVSLDGDLSAGNGAALFDYDGDGDLDLHLVRRGGGDQLYRNDGDRFTESAAAAGVDVPGKGRGMAIGDYDGDGDPDLYLVTEAANRFFANLGDGTFADVTTSLDAGTDGDGALADASSGRSAAFFDVDRDGDLDLFLVNATGVDRLFRNDGGRFLDVAPELGLADDASGRGLALGDYDGDGDTDLFVANSTGGSKLLRNEDGLFDDVSAAAGLDLPGGEVAAAFGDYDGDTRLDLFVSNERGINQLYANLDGLAFADATARDTLVLGAKTVGALFLDYDNDGDLDLATTAVNAKAGGDALYHSRLPFLLPVSAWLGLADEANGRGLSAGDYDGDGRVDLFVADAVDSRLYRNTTNPSHWLQIDLRGVGDNRRGLGARVEVRAGDRRIVRQVQSGVGYGSQVDPRLHFGLGPATTVAVRVRWPDGVQTVATGIAADQLLRLEHPALASDIARAMKPATFRLDGGYPNPFNGTASIRYGLVEGGPVTLTVYNLLGQPVRRLVDTVQVGGHHLALWDGRDDGGRDLASGVYLVRLTTPGDHRVTRLAMVK